MESEKKIQENYEELKKISDKTERIIKFADRLKIEDKDVPKTEKGMASKVKELLEKLEKKVNKEID